MPFFVLGYHFADRLLERLQSPSVKTVLVLGSLGWLVALGLGAAELDPGWLYGSQTYLQLGHPEWYAGVYRLLLFPVQLLAGVAFLGLVRPGPANSPYSVAARYTSSYCTALSCAWRPYPRYMGTCMARRADC
ncbi:hypothetical protein HMSSN139_40770 [Paenibacillus sp. HMSSN-139]|nr:hypothetical protein HMSSN139_40770 [Paenibacillus sp. HMSSN-139]